MPELAPAYATKSSSPLDSISNYLFIALAGRNETWILDPLLVGTGISPVTGLFTNGWVDANVEIGAESASFELNNPAMGAYQGTVKTFPGELVSLEAGYAQSNLFATTNLTWIGSTNPLAFTVQLDVADTNVLKLLAVTPLPANARSFESNGLCRLTWDAPSEAGAAAYRIYARRDDESLYQPVATTTNLNYDTGQTWIRGGNGTNWFFAVVSVGTNGAESPYTEILINSSPVIAAFTADFVSGTPPLTVTFTNQSQGSVTNWGWDFDSDGTIDSTDADPTMVYAQAGSYTVSLTVAGSDGTDTRISVGYINVFLPVLENVMVLSNGVVHFDVVAQAGRDYLIQTSPDLSSWATMTNLTTISSRTTIQDNSALGSEKRFYRIAIP